MTCIRISGCRLIVAICLLLMQGCGQDTAKSEWPYPILDSQFAARGSFGMAWMDNSRVIFNGWEGGKPKTIEEGRKRVYGIYIWDTITNQIEPYKVPANLSCFHDGYISYYPQIDGRRAKYSMLGPIGKEQRVDKNKGEKYNPYSCRLTPEPESMKGMSWLPLLEKHGFIDSGTRPTLGSTPDIVKYHRIDGAVITLPFNEHQVGGSLPLYNQSFNSYLFRENIDYQRWKERGCARLWEMLPTGNIDEQCYPFIDIDTSFWPIGRTRVGIVINSTAVGGAQPKKSGFYLYDGNGYSRLNAGLNEGNVISPDGCRIVFNHKLSTDAGGIGLPGTYSLKMIDLCSTKGVDE